MPHNGRCWEGEKKHLGIRLGGGFFGCCAEAGKLSAKSMAQSVRTVIFFFIVFPVRCFLLPVVSYLLLVAFCFLSPHPSLFTPHGHLMTSSARASTFGGIVTPICLAVFRLMIISNFVGCSTGKSAGFVPLRILST